MLYSENTLRMLSYLVIKLSLYVLFDQSTVVNIEHGSLKTDDSLTIFEVPSQYSTKFVAILTNQSHFKLKIISIL